MMMNLFSLFDPSTNIFKFSLNWFSIILMFFFSSFFFWLIPNYFHFFYFKILSFLLNEFKLILKNQKIFSSLLIFTSLFIFILISNFMSLFSYIFTATSHLVLNLTLIFPLWISFMIFGWTKTLNLTLIHLVPHGTPYILIPFMIYIELISNLIRPITLTVRLTANMIAGHLLLTLLGNLNLLISTNLILLLLIIQILLLTLEFAVAIIQSYVFSILLIFYYKEVF